MQPLFKSPLELTGARTVTSEWVNVWRHRNIGVESRVVPTVGMKISIINRRVELLYNIFICNFNYLHTAKNYQAHWTERQDSFNKHCTILYKYNQWQIAVDFISNQWQEMFSLCAREVMNQMDIIWMGFWNQDFTNNGNIIGVWYLSIGSLAARD